MAIKKIFIFFLLLLLLFTFSFSCFGAKYYTPTEEELYILLENMFFYSSFDFDNDSITAMGLGSIPSSDFIFPSPATSQFFLVIGTSDENILCYPVQFTDSTYHGYTWWLFGANLDLYDDILFPDPGCDLGLSFIDSGDAVYVSLCRNRSSLVDSGEVILSYLPKEEITFDESIKNSLSFLVSGIGEMTSFFITPGQPFFSLMQLLLLGVSITFLFFAVKIIRRFIWGD